MCIAVVGGMDRLAPEIQAEARRLGISVKLFPRAERKMAKRLKGCDSIVLFTNKISHTARREVVAISKRHGIPLYQYHRCGLSVFKGCLKRVREGGCHRCSQGCS